jgi:hypothetical protein
MDASGEVGRRRRPRNRSSTHRHRQSPRRVPLRVGDRRPIRRSISGKELRCPLPRRRWCCGRGLTDMARVVRRVGRRPGRRAQPRSGRAVELCPSAQFTGASGIGYLFDADRAQTVGGERIDLVASQRPRRPGDVRAGRVGHRRDDHQRAARRDQAPDVDDRRSPRRSRPRPGAGGASASPRRGGVAVHRRCGHLIRPGRWRRERHPNRHHRRPCRCWSGPRSTH